MKDLFVDVRKVEIGRGIVQRLGADACTRNCDDENEVPCGQFAAGKSSIHRSPRRPWVLRERKAVSRLVTGQEGKRGAIRLYIVANQQRKIRIGGVPTASPARCPLTCGWVPLAGGWGAASA